MNRFASLIIGYVFLFLGVIGLFLPFLQGVLFIAVGLLILARHAPWAERLLDRLKDRHPVLANTIIKAEDISTRWTDWIALRVQRLFGR